MARRDLLHQERDACGIGFVADASGTASRTVVEAALEALSRMRHRGAVGSDARTGDGAGLLLPIPRALLCGDEEARHGAGVAMFFADPLALSACKDVVARSAAAEGLAVVAWRPVPVDEGALGETARASAPIVEQAIVLPPAGGDDEDAERRAFRARRRAERAARARGLRLYITSLSFRTVTYKALCAADQLAAFYPDLADDACAGWFALFHQRYSTNTTPTWERAQPFRFLAHNGEINTIRGNLASMRSREGRLGSAGIAPEDLLRPVIDPAGSDSAMLDEALELLTRAERDVRHAAAMLVPPAWQHNDEMAPAERAFFRYHSTLTEPWDGPAALVFSDGRRVAACLDRNGLRPLRVAVCEDGLVACASEAGAVPLGGHGRIRRLKLGPGQALSVDPADGGVLYDRDVKQRLGAAAPYDDWAARSLVPSSNGEPQEREGRDLTARQVAAGYTKEEITVVIRPMAVEGHEPTSSMGDDTPQPPLARHRRSPFAFLKQRFAQVTNPPIDHLRERAVMSLTTRLGPRPALLAQRPPVTPLREYPSFVLFPSAVGALEAAGAVVLDATLDVAAGPSGLSAACRRLAGDGAAAAARGAPIVVVSDRGAGPARAPVPSLLAAGAVHHRLMRDGLRPATSIVVDCDDARETHHAACLLANGADAVCPRLTLETIADLAKRGRLGGNVDGDEAQKRFVAALEDGVLKVMSKMGISTLDSYRGAQIVEAIGLGQDVVDACLAGVASALGGLTFEHLGEDVLARHAEAFARRGSPQNTGFVKFRRGGEYHGFNPDVVDALHDALGLPGKGSDPEMSAAHALQRAVKGDDDAYERFARLSDGRPPTEPRDLLQPVPASRPVPVEEVEPAAAIARRFSTGAMSHGALSAEAHETLSIALNMIGGMANTGEGGEAPERYRDARNSGIKQVASGRFGVTPAYLAHARELQIKMAQGSKPGEGGQIPGKKVSVEIARLRHTVPGVALVSPPPHHDIYSIEDLAQLIFDLRQANDRAAVSVKLVASEGVGTIAAGVVKGLADVVHISGGDGGTGASPLSSIKNAGMPWELGLAETQTALVANGLRARARIRVDGGIKTGRDVLLAALLGADEFSFGTAALVAQGCILVRTCHRNTCPVGIATQDPALRARFAGSPEMVARYLMLVADEVRSLLASLGLRSLDEAVGRTDLLRQRATGDPRVDSLDLAPLLVDGGDDRRFRPGHAARPRSDLGDRLHEDGIGALLQGGEAHLRYRITSSDRTVGARLACEAARGLAGRRPRGRVRALFEGQAGQSFGAFLHEGIDMTLIGEANDYVCKGMAGGRVAITAPQDDAGDPTLVGNTVLYGATGGQLYVAGRAGERFAVRNSGAVAVVEGTGDHACEYMTAGAVVMLGPTGRNLGAGMSGGEAYVYDPDGVVDGRLNHQLVAAYEPTEAQLASLRRVILRHLDATGSPTARALLSDWQRASRHVRRIAPVAEVDRLEALFEGTAAGAA